MFLILHEIFEKQSHSLSYFAEVSSKNHERIDALSQKVTLILYCGQKGQVVG